MTIKEQRKLAREKKAHRLFMLRTGSIYHGMQQRRRKILGSGCKPLPFTLDQMRNDLKHALDPGEFLYAKCIYCGGNDLTIKNVSADHADPIERGGKWGLGNLRWVHKSCNLAKGRLTMLEFMALMKVLYTFDASIRREILGRLKAGASVIRLQFLRHRKS